LTGTNITDVITVALGSASTVASKLALSKRGTQLLWLCQSLLNHLFLSGRMQ